MGILDVFGHFLKKKSYYGTMKLGLQAYCGYFQVCVCVWKIAPVDLILGPLLAPNGAKIGKYTGFCRFSWKSFCWNHLKLNYKRIGATFVAAPEAQILGHFWPSNESKFRFLNILFKSFVWIHISLALYAHLSYFQRYVQYGPQLLGHFRPKSKSKFWWLVTFSLVKNFTVFILVLLHMLTASLF